jgi:peroxiredoxin
MKNLKLQFAKQLMTSITIVAFFSIITVLFSSCSGEDSSTSPTPTPTPGSATKAPDFILNSTDGAQVKLSNYTGKVVVVFFFGNSCPSCKAAGPSIQAKLATPYASNSNYQILGLDQWDGNTASVQSFRTIAGVSFPLLLNASSVAASYKTTYDRLVVIDKSGNIAYSGTQGAGADADKVKIKVDELLK